MKLVRAAALGTIPLALLGALLVGAFAPGCRATEYVDHGVDFDRHEVETGRSRSQTVLPGFFLGGPVADLAVVSVGGDAERRLAIHALREGSWSREVDVPLGRDVLFVEVAEIGGRDRLLLGRSGRLSWFDPDTGTEHALLEVTAEYGRTREDDVRRVDVARDLNGDGRDDLVLPDFDGFWIATQASDGSFAEPVRLGPPEPFLDAVSLEHERRYRDLGLTAATLPAYLSRVYVLDHDRDGRSDLVFWDEDHFRVHLQDERGTFDPVARPFPCDVPFDSDGVYSHDFAYAGEGPASLLFGFRARTEHTVLHSFRDVNGDDVADLVVQSLAGRSLVRLRTTLAVHLGEATADGVRFASEASATFRPRGAQPMGYALQRLEDLDGDGELEVALVNVDAGLEDMIQVFVVNSIDLDLYVFRAEDGVYPDEPSARIRVRPDFDRSGRGPFFPAVLAGDVNGDGRHDLLVGQSWEELRVHVGVPGPGLFAQQPQKVEVELPADERNAWLFDLDADGRQDVLVHHPSADEPHRVTMLIAR